MASDTHAHSYRLSFNPKMHLLMPEAKHLSKVNMLLHALQVYTTVLQCKSLVLSGTTTFLKVCNHTHREVCRCLKDLIFAKP